MEEEIGSVHTDRILITETKEQSEGLVEVEWIGIENLNV